MLSAAITLCEQVREAGHPRVEAKCYLLVAEVLDQEEQLHGALDAARTARQIFRRLPEPRGEVEALRWIGKCLYLLGDEMGARQVLRAGVEQAESLGLREIKGVMLSNLAFTYGDDFEPSRYVELTREAIADFRGMEEPPRERLALALTNLAGGLTHLEARREAREAYRDAIELAEELDDRRVVGIAVGGLAEIAIIEGDLEEARRQALEARREMDEAEATWDVLRQGLMFAERAIGYGHPDFALEMIEPLEERLDPEQYPTMQWTYHEHRAEAHEALGEYREALEAMKARRKWREHQIATLERLRRDREEGLRDEAAGEGGAREDATMVDNLRSALAEAEAERRELALAASTDPLTDLPNRRAFESRLEAELEYSRHRKLPLSLIALDLDNFKTVNDTYGHPVGDRVLAEVAGRITEGLRAEDLVARVGGEEFSVMLPGTPSDEAVRVAERLRDSLNGDSVDFNGGSITVTASFGVTAREGDSEAEDLIERADAALYEAKRAGRDTIRTAWADEARGEPASE